VSQKKTAPLYIHLVVQCNNFENRPTFLKVINDVVVAQFFWTHCNYNVNINDRFLLRCMECRRGLAIRILSVRLSIWQTRAL